MMLTPQEIDCLVRRIVAVMRPNRVVMFGSYAKNTATGRSDLDLLVVKETELPFHHRADDIESMLRQMLIHVDVHVYTPEEVSEYDKEQGSFISSALATGKVLFMSGQFASASATD